LWDKLQGSGTLTDHNDVVGTPLYLSPEYLKEGTCDERSDVYAVSMIAYELVTGALPFSFESIAQFILTKVNEDPVEPIVRRRECLPELSDLIMKGLARNPKDRIHSAQEFLHLLHKLKIGSEDDANRRGHLATVTKSALYSVAMKREGTVVLNYLRYIDAVYAPGSRLRWAVFGSLRGIYRLATLPFRFLYTLIVTFWSVAPLRYFAIATAIAFIFYFSVIADLPQAAKLDHWYVDALRSISRLKRIFTN